MSDEWPAPICWLCRQPLKAGGGLLWCSNEHCGRKGDLLLPMVKDLSPKSG